MTADALAQVIPLQIFFLKHVYPLAGQADTTF
jgi:hypothetical protein